MEKYYSANLEILIHEFRNLSINNILLFPSDNVFSILIIINIISPVGFVDNIYLIK